MRTLATLGIFPVCENGEGPAYTHPDTTQVQYAHRHSQPAAGSDKSMLQMQSRGYCGTLEVRAFVRFIEPGTLVAIYAPLPGDKTTYQNDAHGTFKLREQHCGSGPVQHTISILHTPGH